ncbi:TlpA family protein disulfide reductase [Snuella sedimenti]|uniref:TlpA family protein disulfide reductase n=1 Tax=Snuella sedimenti TaxID=2798802 RepID=A0A8J7J3F8_9FLAO|nr:TlpA disulfide reductase family protein [Snuella sedimenti]MBJ6368234.1 TlpA family protein disulfide reductase [Snuella sedimenti]
MLKSTAILALLLPSILLGQYTIKGVFSPAEEYKVALLYKVTPQVSNYVANAKVGPDGSFEFKMDSTAIKGIYRVVYAIPQEEYNFDVIYNGKENIALTFNSEIGVKFQSSVENKSLASYTNSMSMITHSIGKFYREQSKDTLALISIFKTQRETQGHYEAVTKGMIAWHFIKANTPYIPNAYEDVATYTDNLKTHYFDHVDFNNEVLQSSSFLIERMLNYVFGMSTEGLDETANYISNIDVFCKVIEQTDPEIKRSLLVELWQQMVDLNEESVANYIAETYLMDLAVLLNDQELLHALLLYKDISIGSTAPDFSFEVEDGKNKKTTKKLSELTGAENYVLVFWSSTCSHCLDQVPQLEAYVKNREPDTVKVIAVALEEEPNEWASVIKNYPDFIHVYGSGKWENPIGNSYNVTATPTYFILNDSKVIIAKPEDFEALKEFFEAD